MYHARHQGPRAEYREQQRQRITASPSLAQKFGDLKSLTINVDYYDPTDIIKYRQLTYAVNLSHTKSVFRLDCCNEDCVQGDFELTKELAAAAANHTKTVVGELCCNGWQNKALMQKAKCNHVLRYKLKLGY